MLLLVGSSAHASEELFFQVAQPVICDSERVLIVHTPYSTNDGLCCPSVAYTCRANSIESNGQLHNRNAANLLGLVVTTTSHVPHDLPEWMCDTLDVELDLPRIHQGVYDPVTTRQIIEKTEDCIRENAWICESHVRVLRVDVKGPAKYRHLGGTFKVVRYQATPTGY